MDILVEILRTLKKYVSREQDLAIAKVLEVSLLNLKKLFSCAAPPRIGITKKTNRTSARCQLPTKFSVNVRNRKTRVWDKIMSRVAYVPIIIHPRQCHFESGDRGRLTGLVFDSMYTIA